MFNYRLTSFLPHKKFAWTDFGRVYIPHIPPVATPLIVTVIKFLSTIYGSQQTQADHSLHIYIQVQIYDYDHTVTLE